MSLSQPPRMRQRQLPLPRRAKSPLRRLQPSTPRCPLKSGASNRGAWDRRRLSVEVDPTLAQLTTMRATITRHKSLAAKMGHAALAATPPTNLHRPDPLLASVTDDVGMTASMSTATQAAMALLARNPDDSDNDDWAAALQAVARRKSVAGPMGTDRESDTHKVLVAQRPANI
ncbi:hypothetical protein AMAG_18437 [Allomyces macrogynus ATCC 38327]|uniref:Uncharacterized protein n=1 Tax=Allomyces macrogynus (strain ATCC 38327) TaxID=578462 RepID=A0A0L0SBV8_ALLM3|nr:hypothetical protein AMAG_18437 [Allomyces macrogynus ATCC 38327]|eukprot:KNE59890.1 hypothetical protein AMAG_18437 [Allomyces macrogynus ATCC 38327]